MGCQVTPLGPVPRWDIMPAPCFLVPEDPQYRRVASSLPPSGQHSIPARSRGVTHLLER